jgi:hypothetical protein
MEPVGFFTNDIGEPVQALEEQVLVKKLLGGPEGLEISPAGPNPGIGDGIRRVKAMNRMDLVSLWRAVIRRPAGKKDGPVVQLLAPRGTDPADGVARLAAAGLTTPPASPADGALECTFPPGTASPDLIRFCVGALQAVSTLGVTGEWQWTVRKKGLVPR